VGARMRNACSIHSTLQGRAMRRLRQAARTAAHKLTVIFQIKVGEKKCSFKVTRLRLSSLKLPFDNSV